MPKLALLLLLLAANVLARQPQNDSLKIWNDQSRVLHEQRRLLEASLLYEKIVKNSLPVLADTEMRNLAIHFAPRIYTTSSEYFLLENIVAIIHPDSTVIAYHLFWDDDIDFPEDNDPTDHEVAWIKYDPQSMEVCDVITYFHGRHLTSTKTVVDANNHNGRAWIGVEWGKHGSVPFCDFSDNCSDILSGLKKHWKKLHTIGIRRPNHYFARNWPHKFAGSLEDYINFSRFIEPITLLKLRNTIIKTKWANAVLDQYFLPYNFCPKTEWPWE